MQGVGAAEKVFQYLNRKPKHPAEGTEAPDTCTGLVDFKDISFAYPTRAETEILQVRYDRKKRLSSCVDGSDTVAKKFLPLSAPRCYVSEQAQPGPKVSR